MITLTHLYLAYFLGFACCFFLLWFLFNLTNRPTISRAVCPKCGLAVEATFKNKHNNNLYSNCKICGDKLVAW